MRREVRRWGLQNRTDTALNDLARLVNPCIRGRINYYSHFYKSAVHDSLRRIDFHLRKWARRKFKRFKQKPKSAREWFARFVRSTQSSSRTARFYMRTAGYREPDEPRGSRPVLRERGGETPPRHSPHSPRISLLSCRAGA